jgi:hypothetical protein
MGGMHVLHVHTAPGLTFPPPAHLARLVLLDVDNGLMFASPGVTDAAMNDPNKNARQFLAGRFALMVEVAGVEPASEGA